MPDSTRKTISGTQSAMLFGLSPYGTPWSLYQWIRTGAEAPFEVNDRSEIGRALQAPILARVAAKIGMEVLDNAADEYTRHPEHPVGCTRDGLVWHPSRGKGLVQVKCVAWDQMKAWEEDRAPPHVEIQLQHEMLAEQATWGMIAVWLGGGILRLYDRAPSRVWQDRIVSEARAMFARVAADDPPEMFGAQTEADMLDALYPERPKKGAVIENDSVELAADCASYIANGEIENDAKKARSRSRIRILGALGEAEVIAHPDYWITGKEDARGSYRLTVKERKKKGNNDE